MPSLFDALTIEENVALPLELRHDFPLTADQIRQKTLSMLAEVHLINDAQRSRLNSAAVDLQNL